MHIGIIDYGMGNLRSVEKAFHFLGLLTSRVLRPADVALADKLVLPGVGTFGQAIQNLRSQGLFDALRDATFEGKPLLGLCLGLQLLFESSDEFGSHEGLGLLKGAVRRLPADVQVPHIGWNQVLQCRPDSLWEGLPDNSYFYFLHSYYAQPTDAGVVVGLSENGVPFPAVVRQGNIAAAQFHPEKSQQAGLRLLQNFALADAHPT